MVKFVRILNEVAQLLDTGGIQYLPRGADPLFAQGTERPEQCSWREEFRTTYPQESFEQWPYSTGYLTIIS